MLMMNRRDACFHVLILLLPLIARWRRVACVIAKEIRDEVQCVCPCCGSVLFEECASCHKIRHAMLPSCSHCGAEKDEPTADAAR